MTDPKPSKRPRSRLLQTGDDAMRAELLAALEAASWNLTVAARTTGLAGPGSVLRMAERLGLGAELDAARAAGKISPGNRVPK